MIFYDEKKQIKNYNLEKDSIVGIGSLGKIFLIDESTCLKMFNENEYEIIIANYEELVLLNSLKLNNFYEIYNFLFDENSEFLGYTMKFYQRSDIDILTMPTAFTLDNFHQICDSTMIISQNGITIHDLHNENVIMSENTITIVDGDAYYFNHILTDSQLINKNMQEIGNLLSSLYYHALKKYHGYDFSKIYNDKVVSNLVKFVSTYGFDALNSELKSYKYPIDYIKKQTKIR